MTRRLNIRVRSWASIGLAALCVATGCRRAAPSGFELLGPERTGITFANRLPEDTSFNILNYLYYYNGGGVAVGDINNDGLPDLYFTSNLGANRLYLNKGNYQFEDITDRAGVADSVGWKSGVTMADVNGDGWIDIYVSGVSYPRAGVHGRNVLYINNHDGTFTDKTKEYGLDFEGYGTQALFFDYDGDGDLDMYMLNHSVHTEHGSGSAASRNERNPRAGDRLYRNDNGHFVDVSAQAGIYGGVFGYGLGVAATDIDGDGCIDLYVANDFQEDDFLYHNNCDGTFTEIGAAAMAHTSRSSMGVDAADFNNDGRPDIFSADMLPWRQDVLETSATAESYALYKMKLQAGYHPQLAHNALQLNDGAGHFSEIAYLAGVAATDWSWAPLFADLDDDGRKDLFITSGIYRRPTDLDYLAYVSQPAIQRSLASGITRQNFTVAKRMPNIAVPNHAFRNDGNLTFRDVSASWGLDEPGFSNGAAYVDLNNSGALDLVVNRINAPAAIYRNHLRETSHAHFLRVVLRGSGGNTEGIGAKVFVRAGGATQLLEQMPTRGYESSVDHRLHFGLGAATRVDSITVVWPNRFVQILTNVPADTSLTLDQRTAAPPSLKISETPHGRPVSMRCASPCAPSGPIFTDVTNQLGIDWRHRENEAYDLEREPLLPHLLSDRGPALAVGDVNGDGLEDLYLGGAKWQPGAMYLQQRDGTFRPSAQPAFTADSLAEDVDAAIFDANGDGHPDLYVVSGVYEFADSTDALQDRSYLNDGHGGFRRDASALPRMAESGSCVVVGDFNGDGHPDLFVGRRAVLRAYGVSPRSYLLQNDGKGHFRDVTEQLAPELVNVGMVTSAAWVDYDHDGKLDLIVTGEWMPVRVFHQENGRFVDRTREAGLAGSSGWWNSVTVADVNGDGRPDLVLGNLGLNSYLEASAAQPVRLYVGDFAHNGSSVGILTAYTNGASYVVPGRDELLRVLPALRDRYPTYKDFAGRKIEDILPSADLRAATVREADDFASSVAVNLGNGKFALQPLPLEAQFSTVDDALAEDFDGDGKTDVLLAGNDYGVPPMFGRYDASYGLLLRGAAAPNGATPRLEPVGLTASGLVLEGQVRHIRALRWAKGGQLIVAARNDDKLQVLRFSPPVSPPPPR